MSINKPVSMLLLTLVLLPAGAAGPSARNVERVADQLAAAEAARKRGRTQPVSFCLTDGDMNAFLQEAVAASPRPGLDRLRVAFLEGNQARVQAIIDFDAVRRMRANAIPTLLRPVLRGRQEIDVQLQFRAENGLFTYEILNGSFGAVPLPGMVVQKVAETVAARPPTNLDLTRPVRLAYGLRQAWTKPGQVCGRN